MNTPCTPVPAAPLLVSLALASCLLPAPVAADVLDRDWCTGVSPISWGFSVTPRETCQELRLTVRSTRVKVLSAERGPGLPEGWTVTLESETRVVARGATPVRAGQRLPSALVLETNRSSANIGSRGVEPVRWELSVADADGVESASSPISTTFPPVLELSDALSRGLVLVTIETPASSGPVEITVDNPTWQPVWLDVPPGTLLSAGDGSRWVVGLTRPFRMMRKQKTGRTVLAFPLEPRLSPQGRPRRLDWTNDDHAQSELISGLALAIRELERRSNEGERSPGPFEVLVPFDFWPLAYKWAVWTATVQPPEETLEELVRGLLGERAAAGDRHAASIDPAAAAAEVRRIAAELETLRLASQGGELGVIRLASLARFR